MDYFLPLLLIASISLGVVQWRRSGRVADRIEHSQRVTAAMDSLYDRPQIREATEKAQAAIPELRELFRKIPDRASVLVRYRPQSDFPEVVWARLKGMDATTLHCHIRTRLSNFPRRNSISYICPVSDLLDWQVRISEREVRGCFTFGGMRALAVERGGAEAGEEFDRNLGGRFFFDWTDKT